MKATLIGMLMAGCTVLGACTTSAPPSGLPAGSQSAQLPSDSKARDALITCGAGVQSGGHAELLAAYDKSATNGKITADAWRAIEAAFLRYVPANDQQKALEKYQDCVIKLAGGDVEPGAIPSSTVSKSGK